MRVALIFCGQARHIIESYHTIKDKILDIYNVDIYCQLWWDTEIEKKGYCGARNRRFMAQKNTPDILERIYRPKKILIDSPITNCKNQKNKDLINLTTKYNKKHFISQFISLKRVSNLFEWEDYDFIVKLRYDTKILSFPNLYKLDKSKLYVAQDYNNTYINDSDKFLDHNFILPNDMKEFFQIYDYIDTYNSKNYCKYPEECYWYHLNKLQERHRLIKCKSEFIYTTYN